MRITAPALEEPLTGEVYLAAPECDPCSPQDARDGKMIRLFVQVVGEGEDGIVVKLEGTGQINQQTGQITTTFEHNPQLPFSELPADAAPAVSARRSRTPGRAARLPRRVDLTPWSTPFTSGRDADEHVRRRRKLLRPAVQPVVHRRHDEQPGGWVQPVHARRSGARTPISSSTGSRSRCRRGCWGCSRRSRCAANRRPRGHVWPGKLDRRNDGRDRPGRRPVPRHRRQGVSSPARIRAPRMACRSSSRPSRAPTRSRGRRVTARSWSAPRSASTRKRRR